MPDIVRLPTWAMEMTDGTVVRWYKKEGDVVAKGDALAEIETDKATADLESPYAGVLARVLVGEGVTIKVGGALAVIAQAGEQVDDAAGTDPTRQAASAIQSSSAPRAITSDGAPGVKVEPAARRLARELGIDLAIVKGTGPGGRITEADVRAAG